MSTPIYLLIHHTDAFKDSSSKYAELEADIRLMNQLRMNKDINDGVVVEESLGRYSIEILSRDEAVDKLKSLGNKGNYSLYAKMEKPLIVDGRAQNWNNIRRWQDALVSDKKEYELVDDDEYYYLKNKETGKVIEEANIDILKTEKMSSVDVIDFLLNKYRNILAVKHESIRNTRGIAKFAKDNGYDSVIIKNITDNGGRNYNVDLQETADIYVLFNSNQLKSADLVTYDDDGNIIPLSERFNTEDNDIRFKVGDFKEQLKETLADKKPTDGNLVYIGETTSILKQVGLNPKPMLITKGHLRDIHHDKVQGITKYHGLSEDTIAKLPHELDYPAVIFDSISDSSPDSVCVLTTLVDEDKLPIIVAIKPDGRGKYNNVVIDNNVIRTMFGKNNPQAFFNELFGKKSGNILYANKKRTLEVLNAARSYFPAGSEQLRFDYIIHKSKNVVNIKSEKTSNFKAKVKASKKTKTFISKFANTMKDANLTPDTSKSEFEKMIKKGSFAYMRIEDQTAKIHAEIKIKELGFDGALDRWNILSDSDSIPGKNDMALGMLLYNECVNAGDTKNAMKIAVDLATLGTRAGQAVQALSLINKMSADAQLYSLEKSVQTLNRELKSKNKKFKDIVIDEELAKKYFEAKTQKEKDAALDALQVNIAEQIPATLGEKLDAWRYLSMLGNPRTHIRNMVGNALFIPAIRSKDIIATVIERTLPKEKRTKAIVKNNDAKEFAKADFENVEAILKGVEGKYGAEHGILEKRKIYTSKYFKWLEFMRKKNFDFLEKEDAIFLKRAYTDALAQIMTARKITADQLRDSSLESVNILEELRTYAIDEAQRATFREFNELAGRISQFQNQLSKGNKISKAAGKALDIAIPFKQTPANILKQGLAYSPLEFLKVVFSDIKKVRSGEMEASVMIDNISKGVFGTGLVSLGFALASLGLISGSPDDDERKEKFDSAYGSQNYSIKIGDYTYTIDWAAPIALPLFVGVELQALTEDEDITASDALEAMSRITEPILEMSFLQGISDIIESVRYSDSSAIAAIGTTLVTNYVGQFVPTLFGQIARTIDPKSRTYDFNKAENLPGFLQQIIGKTMSKIPFASKLLEPKLDIWGNEITYGI